MEKANLLTKLLDYILEQDKEVDPRGFKLQGYKEFIKTTDDLRGLPGVDFDLKVEGDHVWLRVARLEAKAPPQIGNPQDTALVAIPGNPEGSGPNLNDAELQARVATLSARKPAEQHAAIAARCRAEADAVLASYLPLWQAWAAGEAPRRKTISLYAELFSIKQQLEAEETESPAGAGKGWVDVLEMLCVDVGDEEGGRPARSTGSPGCYGH
jgi:hypothetical protein